MECTTHCPISYHILHRGIIPHQTLTISDIPNHTTFHDAPSFLISQYFISHQHLSQYTVPLCNTIFQISPYRPHYASHHISLEVHPIFTLLTYHITPHSMYSTPQCTFRSHHILHHTTLAPHFACFTSCIGHSTTSE